MARPIFQVREEDQVKVKAMSAHGCRPEDIAKVLNISLRTLRKHFTAELELGAIEANSKVVESLFEMATSGKSTTACIFWVKTRCGWGDTAREEDFPLGGPPQVVIAEDNQ